MTRISTKRDAFKAKSKAELRLVLIWMTVKSLWQCLTQYALFLWQHNPLAVILQRQRRLYFIENYGEVLIKPRLTERILDLFLTDYRRRKRLLGWVHSRLHHVPVVDFCSSWQDGIALCALLESVCPGVCPSYHLLQQHNRVKNCRLGLKLANKYLYLPMDLLSPEEMAIAEQSTEPKIIQYVSMLKWASQNIKDKWTSLHESLIAAKTGKCFAKGSGLRNGIVGRRSKFTIIISDTIGVFNLLVEVRGPNNEYCGERIVSLHQAKGMLDNKSFDNTEPNPPYSDAIKYMEDGSGSTFVRKKVPPRYVAETVSEMIHLDFQCGEEGSFYVTFVPRRAGMHNVSIKWQNHHVDGSPYRVKVYKASNISTKTLKGAQEKRVIYDSLSFSVDGSQEDSIAGSDRLTDDDSQASSQVVGPSGRTAAAIAKSKAYSKGRQLTVTRRRVLRRIITRNGEDIVIEEAVSPTLSRQSSATDNSDDEFRLQRHSPMNDSHKEMVPARSPLASSSFDTHASAHGLSRLGTVEEEEKEKQSSASADSSSCDGQPLDTDAVKDALIRFQSQSSLDQTKHRQYSIDVVEVSADDVIEDIPGNNSAVKERVTVQKLEALNENDTEEILDDKSSFNEIPTVQQLETVKEHDSEIGDSGKFHEEVNETPLERIKEEPEHAVVNYPAKTPAFRTKSDGPLYQLRKEAVAKVTKTHSFGESSSDMSSGEDVHTSPDEENHSSPTLKLLHSSSLKKACMYVSQQKATGLEDEELPPLPRVKAAKKTKLRSTRSLPIMRKLYKRDQVDNCSINDLLKCLKQLERDTSEDLNENYLPNAECHSVPWRRIDDDSFDCEKYAITESKPTAKENSQSNRQRNGTSLHPLGKEHVSLSQGTDNATKVLAPSLKIESSDPLNNDSHPNGQNVKNVPKAGTDENEITANKSKPCRFSFQPPTSMKEPQKGTDFSRSPPSPREPLKRQNPVQSKNSSQESSNESDKKSKGKMSGSTELREESCDTDKGEQNVFRSISIQRSPCKDTLYTSVVHIVIPKPKVDKSTQVTHTEITTETGWNVMEGMYLLLRRLSIKVPTLTEEIKSIDGLHTVMQAGAQTLAPHEISDDNQRVVRTKQGANVDIRSKDETNENKGLPVCIVDTNRRKNQSDNRNMHHVDDWLERNQEIMNIQANLEPARQMTIETVDSGYDDNPSNFNRNPRWSLPLIRQANGHLRLCRKPYKGQMFLPAKLVLSTSSQSQNTSIDKRDNDDEADDEYDDTVDEYHFDANKMNLIRKRRHFSRRVESFSLSDSELETKKSSYKRNRRGWKDVLLVNRLFPRKERTKPLNTWETDKTGTLQKRKSIPFKKTLSVNNTIEQISVESTDDDASVFVDSSDQSQLKPKHTRMNLKNPNPPSSWKDLSSGSDRQLTSISSIEDSYRGFGVSKTDRHDFLSHIDEFQSLCPATTELEIPERNTVEDDDNQFEIKSVSKMSISSRSTESDGIEDEILRSYIREKRHSWDGILDFDADEYDIGINEEELGERGVHSDDGLYTDLLTNRRDSETNFEDNESEIADLLRDHSDVGMPVDLHTNISEGSGHSKTEKHNGDENDDLVSEANGQAQEAIVQDFYEDIENRVRVGGPGLSSGHVGVQNCFQVWSLDPGSGSLNVSITGPRPHTVTETSVLYTGDNLYEVTYEVTQPGFYKIFVKWADVNLPSSPYIAEITF